MGRFHRADAALSEPLQDHSRVGRMDELERRDAGEAEGIQAAAVPTVREKYRRQASGADEMRVMVTPSGWAPFDAEAKEFLRSHVSGDVVEVEELYPRDMIEHRRIMATINDIAKAMHTTPEKVRAELLVATGNFTVLGELLGTWVVAVNSMSRKAMKDHELHEFWSEAREVIISKLLPRISDTAERERLAETLL